MRTKIMLLALTISALFTAGMFLPTFSYAKQVAPSSPALSAASTGVAAAELALTAGHGGSFRDGNIGTFHGGGTWHGGGLHRGFYGGYGGAYVEPYYYATPSCDTVWDPYLNRYVCVDYDTD